MIDATFGGSVSGYSQGLFAADRSGVPTGRPPGELLFKLLLYGVSLCVSMGGVLMRIHRNQSALTDVCVWHKFRPLIPVRTVEGTLRYSEIWRRWAGQFWEYSESPESRGEWTGDQN